MTDICQKIPGRDFCKKKQMLIKLYQEPPNIVALASGGQETIIGRNKTQMSGNVRSCVRWTEEANFSVFRETEDRSRSESRTERDE